MTDVGSLLTALHALVADMPPADAPALLAQISGVTMAVSARLAAASGEQSAGVRVERLSLAELANRLRVGESTIRKMVSSGELEEGVHFTRIRRRLIFRWTAIEQWLSAQPATALAAQPPEAVPFVRRGRRHG